MTAKKGGVFCARSMRCTFRPSSSCALVDRKSSWRATMDRLIAGARALGVPLFA
jgi:hypothetical protein